MEGRDVGELTVVARESVRAVNSLGGAEFGFTCALIGTAVIPVRRGDCYILFFSSPSRLIISRFHFQLLPRHPLVSPVVTNCTLLALVKLPPSAPKDPGLVFTMAYTDDAVKAKLSALNESQESIVTVAQWVMFHRYAIMWNSP